MTDRVKCAHHILPNSIKYGRPGRAAYGTRCQKWGWNLWKGKRYCRQHYKMLKFARKPGSPLMTVPSGTMTYTASQKIVYGEGIPPK